MAGSKNLKNSRRSKAPAGASKQGLFAVPVAFLASAAVMASAVWWFYKTGATLYWGDAESHLDIARRIVDSRTPGWSQIGTTWLPLPHLLMIPLVKNDRMWQTGLAGGITSAASMTLAVTFLFAAIRRLFSSVLAAATGAGVFLLNPNTLYLGCYTDDRGSLLRGFVRVALLYDPLRRNAELAHACRRSIGRFGGHADAL